MVTSTLIQEKSVQGATRDDGTANPGLCWRYLEQYQAEVLCLATEPKPHVFATVYEALAMSRRLGGCSLGRCLHAPMRWVLLRAIDAG